MVSQTIMWTVDAAMVGHVGKVELAAVGLGGMLVWTTYSAFVGLTSSVNTFVAQAWGAGTTKRCGVYLWQGIYVALGAGTILLVIREFAPGIVALLGPDEPVRGPCAAYVSIRMLSAPALLVHYSCAHFFRGIGDTLTPLKILAFAHALNTAGDYALIFGPGPFPALGVEGAAWATSLANAVAAVIFIIVIFTPTIRKRYDIARQWRIRRTEITQLLRVGGPIAVHYFLDMGSFLIFTAYIGRMGTEALAASQIAIQVLALSFMPSQGFAIAATTLMGKYIGAGDPMAAKRSAFNALRLGLIYAGFIALLCLTIPGAMVRIFSTDQMVIDLGIRLLLFAAIFQAFDAVQFIASGGLRGAGDTRVPMFIVVGGAWFVFVPTAYLFGTVLNGGVVGAWAGATCYVAVIGILMFIRLKTERWREIRLQV